MIYCPNCGHENREGARFCSYCRMALPVTPISRLHPGQTMNNGQYRVIRPLSKGGMGAIYLAANTQAFDRLCVIKEMLTYYAPGEEQSARQRFEREAKTLAALKHPGIPDMYGYFSEGGHNYIVMEYIEGENLEKGLTFEDENGQIVPGKPRPLEEALRYGIEICRVLEYLAEIKPEPVVHNDIKPANIIVDKNSGQAVLVDFGTAKARYTLDAGGQVGSHESDAYGTVGYAPPEQYQGRSEPKSDVFALAATLYHVLTDDDPRGHPFQFPKMQEIPADVRMVLQKALALDPRERPTASEFRRGLEAAIAGRSGVLQPIAFPKGEQATNLTSLLDLALKHWQHARTLLYDGSLERWLRQSLYNFVAADQAKSAVATYPEDADAGLDLFLRALDPHLPKPQLRTIERELDFGEVGVGENKEVTLAVVNLGPAGARAEVSSSAPWLQPTRPYLGVAPQDRKDLPLRIANTKNWRPDQEYKATVTLKLTDGTPVSIPVRGRSKARPAPRVRPQRQPKPVVRQKSPGVATWAIALSAIALLSVGAYLLWPKPSGSGRYREGIEAARKLDWPRAQRLLARVNPADREAVAEVGRALDEQLVEVPGGVLLMGREDGPRDEQPAHQVPLPAFLLGRFEVTNVQYQRFLDETGHPPPAGWSNGRFERGKALYPVTGVSWEDAAVYCAWLSRALGREVRLPTEAEWEWAARGPAGSLYPWGDEDKPECRNAGLKEDGPLPVGSYPCGSAPFGAMDMAGNVREWTNDVYAPYQDPHAPPSSGPRRAIRGGSWRSYTVTATHREHLEPSRSAEDLGFRIWVAPR